MKDLQDVIDEKEDEIKQLLALIQD